MRWKWNGLKPPDRRVNTSNKYLTLVLNSRPDFRDGCFSFIVKHSVSGKAFLYLSLYNHDSTKNKDRRLVEIHTVQKILDVIDNRITERITLRELADESGYSISHLGRIFSTLTGTTLMSYITHRRLRYALYDLSCGEKILDIALKYGFETHAGFTKAFKKYFGYPPSIYRIHAIIGRPTRMDIDTLKNKMSGGTMKPVVMEMQPFIVVGVTSRHKIPDVKFTHNIPLYWESTTLEYNPEEVLIRLHNLFNKSRHCEYTVCFDTEPETGEFTYLLGVGVDNTEDLSKIEPDMYEMEMPGGLYAKFTTPPIDSSEYSLSDYAQNVRDTWKNVFDSWLPASGYEFDESRYDFEYYDERDHNVDKRDPLYTNGIIQMDIYIPIKKR